MNPITLINKYYKENPTAKKVLLKHAKQVADKSLEIAENLEKNQRTLYQGKKQNKGKVLKNGLNIDKQFLKEAAMLHDIGIVGVNAPHIGCVGTKPYIMHGVIGAQMLRKEGFIRHARVCERHVGVGLSKKDIIAARLPLPKKDMLPITIEEKIICFADKFFTKRPGMSDQVFKIKEMRKEFERYGKSQARRFDMLAKELGY